MWIGSRSVDWVKKEALIIVVGAPGSGKSTTVNSILELATPFIVFDIDWLAPAASKLTNKRIFSDPASWASYDALWKEVLHSVYKNSKQAIFFTPNSPTDIPSAPVWCSEIRWLLLDCDDAIRQDRLNVRSDWTQARRAEAFNDAAELRAFQLETVDTGIYSPGEVAAKVLSFAGQP